MSTWSGPSLWRSMRRHARQNLYGALACLFVFLGLAITAITSWRAVSREIAAFVDTPALEPVLVLIVLIVQVAVILLVGIWIPVRIARWWEQRKRMSAARDALILMLAERAGMDHSDLQEEVRRWGLNGSDIGRGARGLPRVIHDFVLGRRNLDHLPRPPHYRRHLPGAEDNKWHYTEKCSRWPVGNRVLISWSKPEEKDDLCDECAGLEEDQP